MKRLSQPLRFPEDFRQMVTVLNLNPSALIQRYINLNSFYPFFSKQTLEVKLRQAEKIRVVMMDYQSRGRKWQDVILWDINKAHLDELIELSEDTSLTDQQKARKSAVIIRRWERKAGPLLNYSREIILEDGSRINISFNYMLVCMSVFVRIRKALDEFMSRVSIAILHAHEYSSAHHNNAGYKAFIEDLPYNSKGLWRPDSKAQQLLREEFDMELAELEEEMRNVLNYEKRLVVYRAFMKEWYDKMVAVSEDKTEVNQP